MFYIQVAYKIDGVKSTVDKEVDVAVVCKRESDIQVIRILERLEAILRFRVHVKSSRIRKLLPTIMIIRRGSVKIEPRSIKNLAVH